MAESCWDAYIVGAQFDWDFRFSAADMKMFEQLSGDHNPVHNDPAFARKKGYAAPIVYGLLLSSQLSRLVGEALPDQNAILTGIGMDFMHPAYADDELHFSAQLIDKSDAMHALSFKCRITRAGKTLCRGTANAVWRT
jgi:acyl dehydratase